MQINETTYNAMPAHLRALFVKVPNPDKDEVLALFPQTKSGALTPEMNIKESTGWSGGSSADRVKSTFTANEGSAARFFYCAKASKADRGTDNTHPTVKPTELMVYLVRLVTPPGGVVLDPFTGSGSTGKACMREGMRFVGIDMTPEYVEIARARIGGELEAVTKAAEDAAKLVQQQSLFMDNPS